MIFNVVGLIIGIMILLAGIYYLKKESHDEEARKIYMITIVIGAVITAFIIIKWVIL